MARPKLCFEFKCLKGHQFYKWFALRTKISDNDETTCPECLSNGILTTAYVVMVDVKDADVCNA